MGKRRFAVTGEAFNAVTTVSRYDSHGVSSHTRGWDMGVKVRASVDQRDNSEVFEVWTTGGSNDSDEKVFLGKLTNTGWYPA